MRTADQVQKQIDEVKRNIRVGNESVNYCETREDCEELSNYLDELGEALENLEEELKTIEDAST